MSLFFMAMNLCCLWSAGSGCNQTGASTLPGRFECHVNILNITLKISTFCMSHWSINRWRTGIRSNTDCLVIGSDIAHSTTAAPLLRSYIEIALLLVIRSEVEFDIAHSTTAAPLLCWRNPVIQWFDIAHSTTAAHLLWSYIEILNVTLKISTFCMSY